MYQMTVILNSLLKNNLVLLLNGILYFLLYTFLCMFHPSFFLVPPAIEGGDETSYFIVMVNNLLELDCQVTGSPPPTIM